MTKARKPRRLTSKSDRQMARRIRDSQWNFMEKVAALGTVWWCIWNKIRREERTDEVRCCLISGMELNEWMMTHPDWWDVGEWDDERYGRPVKLTEVGRIALAEREKYDMEPVTGGLVEPGFIVVPAREASA
jgi:hypothetical protein